MNSWKEAHPIKSETCQDSVETPIDLTRYWSSPTGSDHSVTKCRFTLSQMVSTGSFLSLMITDMSLYSFSLPPV